MLMEKRSGQTPKVPESRFNIDAHYHENLARPGSFNVAGGYFLDGRPDDFDPTFFNMTPIEAQWLDPQQRKMLEVSYECLVSAGVTLESVSGSNTAVFVGSFTSDYRQFLFLSFLLGKAIKFLKLSNLTGDPCYRTNVNARPGFSA